MILLEGNQHTCRARPVTYEVLCAPPLESGESCGLLLGACCQCQPSGCIHKKCSVTEQKSKFKDLGREVTPMDIH